MGFSVNSKGVTPSTGSSRVPPGKYKLEIANYEEKTSNNGDPQVIVDCRVLEPNVMDGVPVFGQMIKWHRVTFIPSGKPGAGIWMHWLKVLGEPWGEFDNLDIEPKRWVGRQFWAAVTLETYDKTDGSQGQKNVLKAVEGGLEPEWKPGDAPRTPTAQPDAPPARNGQSNLAKAGVGDDDIPF